MEKMDRTMTVMVTVMRVFVCVSLYLCVYVGMCLYAGKSQDKEVVRMAEKGARKKFPPCSRNCFRLFRPFDILFTPQDTLIKCLLCKSRHHAEPWGSPERTQSNRRGDRDICGQGPDRGKRGVPGWGGYNIGPQSWNGVPAGFQEASLGFSLRDSEEVTCWKWEEEGSTQRKQPP